MVISVCRMISHQQKGCIVITSSAAALMPSPFVSLYGATKAFLSSFGASLAAEVRVLLPIGHVVGLPTASDRQHVQSVIALPSSVQNSNAGAV
jgi:short-subunit dehydrogenase